MKFRIRYIELEVNPNDKIMSIKTEVENSLKIPDYCQYFIIIIKDYLKTIHFLITT